MKPLSEVIRTEVYDREWIGPQCRAALDWAAQVAALEAHIEALEIKAATWLALASPIWVGDESEGHFVCLACNQAGTDDGGCKTIQHLPDCEYAAALAKEKKT